MKLGTRINRTIKVGWASAVIWSSYKVPSWGRKLTGRPPRTEAELNRRVETKMARKDHYYDTSTMAQDMETIRIELKRCLDAIRLR